MPDLQDLFDQSASAMRAAGYWSTRTARLMIGVPDYETYVAHRRANHPDPPIMTYVEFFPERQQARYAVWESRVRSRCCGQQEFPRTGGRDKKMCAHPMPARPAVPT